MKPQLYLASSSPRRQQLLAQIGVCFEQLSVEIDERYHGDETAEQYVSRMAVEKARAGLSLCEQKVIPVLGADTALELNGDVLGKPRDRQHGLEMLGRLSGCTHRVLTGVALVAESEEVRIQCSSVTFREISEQECAAYWALGESHDKAGAYGIQGMGAMFISHLVGSYSGVMGLPLFETSELLEIFGISVLEGNSAVKQQAL